MTRLRWKWIGYYLYSNLVTLIFFIILLLLFNWNFQLEVVLYAIAGTIIISLTCGLKFTKNIRNRLEAISIGAKNLAYGNLKYRLAFTENKETSDLALAFNEMADRLEQQVITLQKLAAENNKLIEKAKTSAITDERQRLARELHDAVSQQLFAISLTAATANKIFQNNPQKSIQLINDIEIAATKAQTEMRGLILQLRPVNLEKETLVDAINSLANDLQARQIMKIKLELNQISLPSTIENQLYRISQEALSNVLRHSEATSVTIKLKQSVENSKVELIIEDNGKGFEKAKVKESYGLMSIKERAFELGGTVDWITFPGKGTRLEVRIPLLDYKRKQKDV